MFVIAVPPIVVVEWLTLLICIREVPGSNFGLETGDLDSGFHGFPHSTLN
jgi:hypothetical protein